LGRTVNYISCVFIVYKNVFGPIAVLVANCFRLEQKSYLLLKLQFKSGFGKTTIFNDLLGNRPNVFCWASDYLIWSSFWLPEWDISRIWQLGDVHFRHWSHRSSTLSRSVVGSLLQDKISPPHPLSPPFFYRCRHRTAFYLHYLLFVHMFSSWHTIHLT
jgi:hypothetical protein